MSLLRFLVVHCMRFNILMNAKHIAGKTNVVSDLISRLQVSQARLCQPSLDLYPAQIPETLTLSRLLMDY